MSHLETPPFPLGTTLGVSGTDGADHLGREYEFEDVDLDNPPVRRSDHRKRVRVVRNSSGAAMLPSRVAVYKTGTKRTEVDGYVTTTAAAPAGVVDEWLPSAGVSNEDVFYITVDGPTTVLTDIAASATNVVTEGAMVVALTAVTSQATTAGRVASQTLTGSSQLTDYTTIANQIQNVIGRAMSASTTNETATEKLIYATCRWA